MSWRIKAQANNFFNTYKLLCEHNDTATANLAELAGKPLSSDRILGAVPIMGVEIVCLAFAVELYVKDVYWALNEEIPRGKDAHNILKLFEKLPENIQLAIFTHDAIISNPFMTKGDIFSPQYLSKSYSSFDRFKDQIEAISMAFVKWRYSYEHNALRYDISFASAFIEAAKSTAENIRAKKLS